MRMMHGSELNYDRESVKESKGQQHEIACYSWTSASGEVKPLMFKLKDESGEIRTFDRLHVNSSRKLLYCGIGSYEFDCDVRVSGISVNLTLQYFPEQCKWYLLTKIFS